MQNADNTRMYPLGKMNLSLLQQVAIYESLFTTGRKNDALCVCVCVGGGWRCMVAK